MSFGNFTEIDKYINTFYNTMSHTDIGDLIEMAQINLDEAICHEVSAIVSYYFINGTINPIQRKAVESFLLLCSIQMESKL